MLSRLKTALRAVLRKADAERELDDELRYHIEQQTGLIAVRNADPTGKLINEEDDH